MEYLQHGACRTTSEFIDAAAAFASSSGITTAHKGAA
jgi:hypothetical protein